MTDLNSECLAGQRAGCGNKFHVGLYLRDSASKDLSNFA